MPQDNDFLKTFFVDCQNAMRWRSETEYKLLNMFIVQDSIIITAIVGINQLAIDKTLFFWYTIAVALYLFVLTIFITRKINAEHDVYTDIGKQVQKIWEYFELFERGSYITNKTILDKKLKSNTEKGYGQGPGYKKTKNILWAMTGMTIVIIVSIGYFSQGI